jgi:uncharacterized phiE125 gp8 family phage protein
MQIQLIIPPSSEPISLEELKLHLRIDDDDTEDEYLEGLITVAREHVEDITRRAIMTQTWDYYLDEFPDGDAIKLPFGNLQAATLGYPLITYMDCDSKLWTMVITTDYLVETNGEQCGRIVLPYAVTWPTDVLYPSNPITIRYKCGWTTAALVPFKIKAAIKMICADMYEMRGEPVQGQTVVENKTVGRLLNSERLWDEF